jgi:hypothetical protein
MEFVEMGDGSHARWTPGCPAFENIKLTFFECLHWLALDLNLRASIRSLIADL